MIVKIRVDEPEHEPRVVCLEGQTLTIGRSRSCDLVLSCKVASRQHAEILFDGGCGALLDDLGSRNGIEFNKGGGPWPRVLAVGDEIEIGPATLIVLDISTDETDATAASAEDEPEEPLLRSESEDGVVESETESSRSGTEDGLDGYDAAAQALREDYDCLWQVLKSKTPPHLVGEMGALNSAVKKRIDDLDRAADGVEDSNDRLLKLLDAARVISAPQPLKERLETILDLAISKMNADSGFLMLYSRRKHGLRLALQRGMAHLKKGLAIEEGEPTPRRPSVSIAHQALKSGTTVFRLKGEKKKTGKSKDFGARLAEQGIHAAICAPMKVEKRFLGLIYVDYRDPNRLNKHPVSSADADWLESLGSLSALAIENARLIEKARAAKKRK